MAEVIGVPAEVSSLALYNIDPRETIALLGGLDQLCIDHGIPLAGISYHPGLLQSLTPFHGHALGEMIVNGRWEQRHSGADLGVFGPIDAAKRIAQTREEMGLVGATKRALMWGGANYPADAFAQAALRRTLKFANPDHPFTVRLNSDMGMKGLERYCRWVSGYNSYERNGVPVAVSIEPNPNYYDWEAFFEQVIQIRRIFRNDLTVGVSIDPGHASKFLYAGLSPKEVVLYLIRELASSGVPLMSLETNPVSVPSEDGSFPFYTHKVLDQSAFAGLAEIAEVFLAASGGHYGILAANNRLSEVRPRVILECMPSQTRDILNNNLTREALGNLMYRFYTYR